MTTKENSISVSIRGMHPRPWVSNEVEWRGFISQACRRLPDINPSLYHSATWFSVSLTFYLTQPRFTTTDLDNLAKPVVDTLFHVGKPQTEDHSLTGALIQRNDREVWRLNLEKRVATTEEEAGVDVLVQWE